MTPSQGGDAPACLVIVNDLSELARVTAWVHAWAKRHGVAAGIVERLDLCSLEALTNIITYGYSDRAPHQIALQLEHRAEGVALEIHDDGREFDPRQAQEPQRAASLEQVQIGGWGLRLLRQFSDELHYCRSGGCNYLTVIFQSAQRPIDYETRQATQ